MTAPTIIAPFRPIRCKHCTASAGMTSIEVARAQGWRFFVGTSVTGKPLNDVVCPRCGGTRDGDEPLPASWRVGCRTCDWEWEDEDGDEPLDEKAARQMARDHECEPWTWVKAPDADDESKVTP